MHRRQPVPNLTILQQHQQQVGVCVHPISRDRKQSALRLQRVSTLQCYTSAGSQRRGVAGWGSSRFICECDDARDYGGRHRPLYQCLEAELQ